jgi:hypothetical protein
MLRNNINTMDSGIGYLGFKGFMDLVDKDSFTLRLRHLDICNASTLRDF